MTFLGTMVSTVVPRHELILTVTQLLALVPGTMVSTVVLGHELILTVTQLPALAPGAMVSTLVPRLGLTPKEIHTQGHAPGQDSDR
jgi:uncharacterized membrane protein YjjB (DUF3815 family)